MQKHTGEGGAEGGRGERRERRWQGGGKGTNLRRNAPSQLLSIEITHKTQAPGILADVSHLTAWGEYFSKMGLFSVVWKKAVHVFGRGDNSQTSLNQIDKNKKQNDIPRNVEIRLFMTD